MFQLYPLVLIFQAICVYHAYKKGTDQKWFWLIIFLPLIGGGLYLYDHFYSKENVATVAEGVKSMVNSNYETDKLEKRLALTDSQLNRTNLADQYVEIGRYDEAIELYQSCTTDTHNDSTDLLKSLSYAHYKNGEYADCVKYGDRIKDHKEFNKNEEKVGYAWALYHLGENEKAETVFKEMDSRFNNYTQRLEYGRFLNLSDRKPEALEHLNNLLSEFVQMLPQERKHKRAIHNAIKLEIKEQTA